MNCNKYLFPNLLSLNPLDLNHTLKHVVFYPVLNFCHIIKRNFFKLLLILKFMFIVFEGIDGCGKSTQVWKLAQHLSSLNKYHHIHVTREPYKSRGIREILKLEEPAETRAEKLSELFIKDRQEHVDELIKPAIEKNIIIISDRYKYSTICYQSAQGQDIKKLIELHRHMPVPDFIFIIDTQVEVSSERISQDNKRSTEHKFEKNKDFLNKVRDNYLNLKNHLPEEKIIIINGDRPVQEIFEEIKSHFKNI